MQRRAFLQASAAALALSAAPRLLASGVAQNARLATLADQAYALWAVRNPAVAYQADPEGFALFDDSEATVRALATRASAILAETRAIDRASLSARDLALLNQVERVGGEVAGAPDYFHYTFNIDSYLSPVLGAMSFFTGFALTTPVQRARYLRLVAEVGNVASQAIVKTTAQAKRGIVPPVAVVDSAVIAWRQIATDPLVAGGHFLMPKRERLSALNDAEAAAYSSAVARQIRTSVQPPARKLVALLGPAFRARAPRNPGLHQYPGGDAAYRRMVLAQLTVDIDPAALHVIGQERVDHYAAQIAAVQQRLGYAGPPEGFDAYFRALPGTVARQASDWQPLFDAALARIRPKLASVFAVVPTTPAVAQRMPQSLEKTMTYGWFDGATKESPQGVYHFNGTPGRLMSGASDLIYHELLPGHHMQNEVSRLAGLHPIQADYYSSFYSEGWGEYSSVIARELGCFVDDIQLYGHLSSNRFMAARIVLDTGMNALGWPLDKAREYMRANTPNSDGEIESELIRYGARMPGQALGYHFGMMKMVEERERARQAMGARFDIRAFHSVLLDNGDIPYTTMRALVDRMIAGG